MVIIQVARLSLLLFASFRCVDDPAAHDLYEWQTNGYNCSDNSVEQEEKEGFHVVQSNTVANPHAVVVHSHDASVALRTVMRSRRFDCLARAAPPTEFLSDQMHLTDIKRAHFPYFYVLLSLWLWESNHASLSVSEGRTTRLFATFFAYLLVLYFIHLLLLCQSGGRMAINNACFSFMSCFKLTH